MHGIIFSNLYRFIIEKYEYGILEKIKKEGNITTNFYDATTTYPDAELQTLVSAASKVLETDIDQLLEAFGKYIAPGLLKTYSSFMNPEWDCMDLLEHVESSIHKTVRMSMEGSTPPLLNVERLDKDRILIKYTSERKMISLGIGIIKAIGNHYNENIHIEQEETADGTNLIVMREK